MVVVEVINSLQRRAGAEVFLSSISRELSKRKDYRIVVISLFDGVDSSFELELKQSGIDFYCCNKRKWIDLKASKTFRQLINKINPDIIHTHLSCLLTYFFAFGLKKRKWNIFHTVHNVPSKESNLPTNILKKIYCRKKMLTLIGISKSISTLLLKQYPEASVVTINNGIDLFHYKTKHKKIYDFIIVARFTEQKNHQLLFDAFENAFSNTLEPTLLCVGDGELLEHYKKYISEFKTFKRIIFYGKTNNVIELLAKSRCFVLSSIYEGNPLSILEAMNAHLPIIAPRVGGIPDIVHEPENGFLFEPNDIDKLTLLLKKATNEKSLFESIGEFNCNDVKKYSIAECANQYATLFERVLEKE